MIIDTQILILKRARKRLKRYFFYNAEYDGGLCALITEELKKIHYYELCATYCIPLFNIQNAKEHANAAFPHKNYPFWWKLHDKKSRIKFLNWMINELEKQN